MTTSVITALETSLQKTNIWIREIGEQIQCDDQRAYHALRAVLHALRDRLSVVEASDLASQLPLVIRGVFYENWRPSKTPVRDRTKDQFLRHIFDAFPNDLDIDPEEVVRSVFEVMTRHVSDGEIQDVKDNLPKTLQEYWP